MANEVLHEQPFTRRRVLAGAAKTVGAAIAVGSIDSGAIPPAVQTTGQIADAATSAAQPATKRVVGEITTGFANATNKLASAINPPAPSVHAAGIISEPATRPSEGSPKPSLPPLHVDPDMDYRKLPKESREVLELTCWYNKTGPNFRNEKGKLHPVGHPEIAVGKAKIAHIILKYKNDPNGEQKINNGDYFGRIRREMQAANKPADFYDDTWSLPVEEEMLHDLYPGVVSLDPNNPDLANVIEMDGAFGDYKHTIDPATGNILVYADSKIINEAWDKLQKTINGKTPYNLDGDTSILFQFTNGTDQINPDTTTAGGNMLRKGVALMGPPPLNSASNSELQFYRFVRSHEAGHGLFGLPHESDPKYFMTQHTDLTGFPLSASADDNNLLTIPPVRIYNFVPGITGGFNTRMTDITSTPSR